MFFKYTNFDDGLHQINLIKSAAELDLSPPFIGDVNVDCNIDKSTKQIVLNCVAECDAEFECDRCNSVYSETLIVEFTMVKVFNPVIVDPEDSDVEYHPPEVAKIDISKDLKEFLSLAVPMKKLCSDDCKGLCIVCGKNLNEENCDCNSTVDAINL